MQRLAASSSPECHATSTRETHRSCARNGGIEPVESFIGDSRQTSFVMNRIDDPHQPAVDNRKHILTRMFRGTKRALISIAMMRACHQAPLISGHVLDLMGLLDGVPREPLGSGRMETCSTKRQEGASADEP